MRGLKAVQQLGDDVNWREIVAYYQQAADEVRRFFVFVVAKRWADVLLWLIGGLFGDLLFLLFT